MVKLVGVFYFGFELLIKFLFLVTIFLKEHIKGFDLNYIIFLLQYSIYSIYVYY